MKAVICVADPEEETILCQVFRFAHVVPLAKQELKHILDTWSEDAADLLLIATTPEQAVSAVGAIRAVTDVPLILILDPPREDACIELYTKGADLLVLRPYSHRLLKVQAEVLLRRGMSLPLSTIPTLHFGNYTIDPPTRTLQRTDGSSVTFTRREFQLLYLLFTHQGHILQTESIIESIWGYDGSGDKNMLRSLINRVRRKIEENPDHPRHLVTVTGVGYRLQV